MFKRSALSGRAARRLLVPVVAILSVSGGSLALTSASAGATGTTIGYACAVYTNVSLFGGPYGSEGCGTQTSPYATANTAAPSATWAYGAPVSNLDSGGAKMIYGPADIVSSPWLVGDVTSNTGALLASTNGTTNVNATAKATGVGPSPFYTSVPGGADNPSSPAGYALATCTATPTGSKTGTVNISKGWVDTKLDADGYPVTTVPVAFSPAANTRVDFTIDNIGDHGHMVFNERINNADGSLTINAAHMYMEGPTAFGEAIISQVICGHA